MISHGIHPSPFLHPTFFSVGFFLRQAHPTLWQDDRQLLQASKQAAQQHYGKIASPFQLFQQKSGAGSYWLGLGHIPMLEPITVDVGVEFYLYCQS